MTKLINANTFETQAGCIIDFSVACKYKGRKPKLVILVASDDKASKIYVNNKVKMGAKYNIDVEVIKYAKECKNNDIIKRISLLNVDKDVDGIMLQLPVYNHLNPERLINAINPNKDVDGLTMESKALLECNKAKFIPCTPEGVVSLLQIEGVVIEGKKVVVVGKGETAGAPMATVFRNHNATVTICHVKTPREDLEFYVRHADIVISCVGKMNVIEADWFKEGSIAIGVGFTYDENGKQQLDFDVDKVVEIGKAAKVSQRTNCTGKATVVSLMCNVVSAYLSNM